MRPFIARIPRTVSSGTRSLSTTIAKTAPLAARKQDSTDYDMSTSASTRSAAQWADFGRSHINHGLGRLRDEVFVKGQGLELLTADGKRYLDFTAGIGVTNLGHCHPAVSAAAAEQVNSLVHLQCSIGFHSAYLELIDKLLPVMPHPSLDNFFFWNSGSEAVEAAIKMARKATGRDNIICFQGAYHGRTYGSGAVTRSKTIYTQSTGPLMPQVYTTAYPYWHSLGVDQGTSEEEIVRLAKFQLDMMLRQQTAPQDTAAILIEPVQGEGGYVPCPPAFLTHLREVCDKHGIQLILDEVQTGFYRTGKYFATEYTPDLRADIMIFAKGVANGFPVSGVVTNKSISDKMDVGSLGGTYAGNAVACAAGVAAQDVYAHGGIKENVAARSKQLYDTLHKLAAAEDTKPLIAEVRGLGLMTAIEFRLPGDQLTHTGLPAGTKIPKDIGKRVQKFCLDKNLMLLTTSCFDTIRFIPALVITEEEMTEAMEIFTEALQTVAREG